MTRGERLRMLPLQAGAMLGPMTGTGVVTLIPVLAEAYGVAVGPAGLSITAYMVPFALVQLFSGSLAQIVTGRRTALAGFAVFAGGSVACAVAPSFPAFLAFRLVQGVGGAFLFPVLMAAVGEVVAPAHLGRAIGAFGATQTLGLAVGPVLAGAIEVRLGWPAFFLFLAAAAAVAGTSFGTLFSGETPPARAERGMWAITWSVLRSAPVLWLSLAATGLFFAMIGAYTYLAVSLRAGRGLTADQVGVVLAVAGLVGIPASAVAGRWVDRFGRREVILAGLGGYLVALLGFALVPYSYVGTVALAAWLGWTGAVAWAGLNTLAVEIDPALRKPVASVYNAFRFMGYSLAPPVLGLVYARTQAVGVYLTAALVVVISGACVVALRQPGPGPLARSLPEERGGRWGMARTSDGDNDNPSAPG